MVALKILTSLVCALDPNLRVAAFTENTTRDFYK